MDRTLKALSLILSYPTLDLKAASQEIEDILDLDRRLSGTNSQVLASSGAGTPVTRHLRIGRAVRGSF